MKALPLVMTLAILSYGSAPLAQMHQHEAAPASQSAEAERAFSALKSLDGTWVAKYTVEGPLEKTVEGQPTEVTIRVTSRGHAIVHEMHGEGLPEDPAKYDHPVTMIYLDSGQLTLTHYCDAGNRPRMMGHISPDGKTVTFDFADVSGDTKFGYMRSARFTLTDRNHHTEEWTYLLPGDKAVPAQLDLERKTTGNQAGR